MTMLRGNIRSFYMIIINNVNYLIQPRWECFPISPFINKSKIFLTQTKQAVYCGKTAEIVRRQWKWSWGNCTLRIKTDMRLLCPCNIPRGEFHYIHIHTRLFFVVCLGHVFISKSELGSWENYWIVFNEAILYPVFSHSACWINNAFILKKSKKLLKELFNMHNHLTPVKSVKPCLFKSFSIKKEEVLLVVFFLLWFFLSFLMYRALLSTFWLSTSKRHSVLLLVQSFILIHIFLKIHRKALWDRKVHTKYKYFNILLSLLHEFGKSRISRFWIRKSSWCRCWARDELSNFPSWIQRAG